MTAVRPLVCSVALALLSAPLAAQMPGLDADGEALSLPYLDVRHQDDRATDAVLQAVVDARTTAQRAARQADLARLRGVVPGVKVEEHEFFGTPSFVRSTSHLLTGPQADTAPRDVVRGFVDQYAALFEVPAFELDMARLSREYVTRHNGVTHLTYQQQLNGLDVWGAELKANVTADGALINVSSALLPRPADGFGAPAAQIGPSVALRLAAHDAGVDVTQPLRALGSPVGLDARQTWAPTSDFRDDIPITTRLLWFPVTRTELHPAWEVVVPVPGIGNTYETLVDAVDGSILRRWNQMHFLGGSEDITFNIWPDDSPAPLSPGLSMPSNFQAPIVPRVLTTITGASVMDASPEGWIPDGQSETLGNNVDAHGDLNADNNPDLPRPDGGPTRTFDFPIDLATQTPPEYLDAAVTQLFYYSNVYHDALYRLGWDEAASNLQDDNFGLGGVGGDRLQADAQDGSTVDNAQFFGSGSDGSSARIQMYPFVGPDPDKDGSLDGDVVYHEITHGLSIRLSGGTVFGEQSGGMGEGWGDYFGISLNAKATDDPDGVYAMGGYITEQFLGLNENYYFGIRRYPYTTDLSRSPLTYADTDPAQISIPGGIPNNAVFIGNPADQVHAVGEIWCNALLAARSALWATHGFAANELLMQLVVDGLKLMPSNPNLVEARDAILQADLVNNGGANLGDLWAGFALRGLGGSASSPSGGSSTSGVVEAFDVPALVIFGYANGQPSELDPSVATGFPVSIDAFGGTSIVPGSETLRVSVNGAPAVGVPLTDLGGGDYLATLPASDCFDELDFWLEVDTNTGLVTNPTDAPTEAFSATVFTGVADVFVDDFEASTGWTAGAPGDTATTGVWELVDPVGTAAQPEDDNTPGGTLCFVTGQGLPFGGLGDNDVDGGFTTLTSPVIDLSAGDAVIGYDRWYSNDTGGAPNADVFTVDISNNGGGSWVNVETVGPTGDGTSGGWIRHEFTVSDFVTPTANVQVRFIAADEGTGSLVEAGVDEFAVFNLTCDAACQPDLGFGGPGDLALSICGSLGTGDTAAFLVENAAPLQQVFVVIGFSNAPTAFKGGLLVPVPIAGLVVAPADGAGELALGLPGGGGPASVFFQAAAQDAGQPLGFELSNAVEALFLP